MSRVDRRVRIRTPGAAVDLGVRLTEGGVPALLDYLCGNRRACQGYVHWNENVVTRPIGNISSC